jgi:acetyltransferase-like isoleucine patch superfamily enzyme
MASEAFRGVTMIGAAVCFYYAMAIAVYRMFILILPLPRGELPPGSKAEFTAQVSLLFYLMIFNSLIKTHFIPIPFMRLVYMALGAKLGTNTYSAGVLIDPPLTSIGKNSIVGHGAAIFAHVIEGDRFEFLTVDIGDDVTIGTHAVICPGVVIGNGAIIAIGAVVAKGSVVGSGEIWGGVPARRLGRRDDYP